MKIKIILFLLFFSAVSYCQTFEYPVLPSGGNGVRYFIPQGWKVIDSASGDLNNDNYPDAVYIIQYSDTVKEYRAFGPGENDYDLDETIPRILVILFKEPAGDLYQLGLQNNTFILRSNEGGVFGDPLAGLSIDNNVLTIEFFGGSRNKWGLTYKFRFQDKDWRLIGATNLDFDSLTGDYEECDYNFLKKKMKITAGNENNNEKKEKRETIKIKKLKTFKTFVKPWTWEVKKGRFL